MCTHALSLHTTTLTNERLSNTKTTELKAQGKEPRSRRWRDRATTLHRPSDIFDTCLTTELAQTLACSLILSRIDYCNAVLHGAPSYSIKKLQQVQNNAARIVLKAPRRSHVSPLLRTLHWLPVQQRIDYKVALLTFKVRSTSTSSYLRLLIQDREHGHNLRSTTTALRQPFTATTFVKCAF